MKDAISGMNIFIESSIKILLISVLKNLNLIIKVMKLSFINDKLS